MAYATNELVSEWITDDHEWIEIIADLINGNYTVEALRQDFEEAYDDIRSLPWVEVGEESDE